MNGQFPIPKLPLVVYTDLDGSLLDHNSYSFDAASPALQLLQSLNIPIIPVTSKTLCEVEHLFGSQLQIRTPVIAENGGVIAFPSGYFPVLQNFRPAERYVIREVKPDYQFVTSVLNDLRHKYGFIFYGFRDMCESQVSEITGLTPDEASRAKWRRCSEPILWRDSQERLATFKTLIAEQGLSLTQGGRFLHVTGKFDKGHAMQTVDRLFQEFGLDNHMTIALGDSPNDMSMLKQADIAVAIKRPDGSHLLPVREDNYYMTEQTGPAGWNSFVTTFIEKQVAMTHGQRRAHG